MSLSLAAKNEIVDLLTKTVRDKIKAYNPETKYMPFHHRLLGRDRYAMFSFVQSMNTTFGMSIWEQIAVILGNNAGNHAERQYTLCGEIDDQTEDLIYRYHTDLRKSEIDANKQNEMKMIRQAIKKGTPQRDPDSVVDLFIVVDNTDNYFDITSAKPNMKEFSALKIKLLRWTALKLSQDKNAQVFTRLAIPYNPYYPEPYERWTLKGLFDLDEGEVLVGEDFWNFIAGDNIYNELLDLFEETGDILRDELDEKFRSFR